MANANTFASVSSPKQVINAATETVLVNALGTPASVGLTPQAHFDGGRPFIVRLRGVATGGTGATLAIKLYLGSSATVGSDSAVIAFLVSGAAIPVGGGQFNLSVELQWDSVSQTIHGTASGHTNGTINTVAVTAQTGIASESAIVFVASATFGAALATNSVTLTEFNIDQN